MNNFIVKENLVKDLEKFQKDNICEYASNKCKSCVFNIENGCAYNLVINVLSNNLSFNKEISKKQYKEIMRFK